ncbi:O-antigen ligase family protein [Mycobacterium sp. 050128]|uniref:O-antigen ligase family protein n=1 Tax=Mycobacterium sp. 050128 TaxID=3096112 RepID=UPI002EDB278F
MIPYLRSRDRLVVAAALLTVFLVGCFLFGVFSVRRTTEGVLLIAALFCLVVYWVKPEGMVAVTFVGAFAALPEGLHVGKVIGPVAIYAYQITALLSILYLLPKVKPRFSDYLLPGVFAMTVLLYTFYGFWAGHDDLMVARESTTLLEMVAGFVLGMLVVWGRHAEWLVRVVIVILWFSAGMAIVSSLHAVRLAGRAESLEEATGAGQALRIVLSTQTPATAVLSALVAAAIVGRVKPMMFYSLGPPALIISLLSFSRNTLIAMVVAALVALLSSFGLPALRRLGTVVLVSLAALAVTVPGSLFLLQHSQAGAWLSDQFAAFGQRVLGGISTSALAVDQSTLDRLQENARLNTAIAEAPIFGHGLGYAYQLPTGNDPDAFSWKLGPTYSHLFYQWWLAKAGVVGVAVFAWFAATPIIRAARRASAPAKISAAVSTSLLAISAVWPLPEMPMDALALGLALGATMGFAELDRRDPDAGRDSVDEIPELAAAPS